MIETLSLAILVFLLYRVSIDLPRILRILEAMDTQQGAKFTLADRALQDIGLFLTNSDNYKQTTAEEQRKKVLSTVLQYKDKVDEL